MSHDITWSCTSSHDVTWCNMEPCGSYVIHVHSRAGVYLVGVTLKQVFHNMSHDFISRCMDSHDVMWSLYREKYLFSGSVDHSIKIWDMESCEVVSTIPAHENPVCTLTINGSRLYSGSLKSIKVMGLCAPASFSALSLALLQGESENVVTLH